MTEIPVGICQCGCGLPTTVLTRTKGKYKRGQLREYIHGHNSRVLGIQHRVKNQKGSLSSAWKGGIGVTGQGYILIQQPSHPRANKSGYVQESILVAEEALGKPLPTHAVIHHANENQRDNRNNNLVICENNKYHKLLHMRLRAFKACGNPNWRKCRLCWKFDRLENLSVTAGRHNYYHKHCNALRTARLNETRSET